MGFILLPVQKASAKYVRIVQMAIIMLMWAGVAWDFALTEFIGQLTWPFILLRNGIEFKTRIALRLI